ncbi:MAG: NAD-dependent epimerase/dehydratase family protein, partial [Caldilineaceae bacterium]
MPLSPNTQERIMRVFVTGATGFIGQKLVDSLLRRGWLITALVRNAASAEAKALAAKGVTLAPGDITNPDSMRGPMAGADIVIHNAAWYEVGVGGREAEARMQEINVTGTRNTLSLAHELGVPRIVHVSSIVAVGDSRGAEWDESNQRVEPASTTYERTKTEAHAIALDLISQGAPILIGMPGSVFGPGDHANLGILQRMYVRGTALPTTIGHGGRSNVHVDDCAECIALIAEKGRIGESYIICTGYLTYAETYAIWAETPGGMRPWFTLPAWMAVPTGWLFESGQRLFGLPNLLSAEAARAAEAQMNFSGAKARRELGWQPGNLREQWHSTLAEERRRAGIA